MSVFPDAKLIEVSPSITLSVHEIVPDETGTRPAVIFCHGFPDLAFGWRHQLTAVADSGYRAIAPDQRTRR